MTISQVSGHVASAGGTGATAVTTASFNTTAGNLVHLDFGFGYTSVGSPAASDNDSNTWTQAGSEVSANNNRVRQYYCLSIKGKVGNTFTFTSSGGGYPSICASEYTSDLGAGFTFALDQTGSTTDQNSATPSVTTGGATAQNSEVAIGGVGGDVSNSFTNAGSGWTENHHINGNASTEASASGYQIQTATGSPIFQPTFTASNRYNLLLATYKDTAAAGGSVFNPYFYRQHIARAA